MTHHIPTMSCVCNNSKCCINGIRCIVKANNFFADKNLHQYDVSITPKLVKLYRESHLGKRLPAYDGRKSLHCWSSASKEFKITIVDGVRVGKLMHLRKLFRYCPVGRYFYSPVFG